MSGTSALAPIPLYLSASHGEAANVAKFQVSDPATQTDITYFQQVAPSLKSVSALLGNYRALGIVLNAFGMGSAIGETGLLKDLLTQDPTSSDSVAAQLANPAYTRFATAMQQFNPPPFTSAANIQAVVTALATNNYESAQDTLSPGLANALYFARNITSLTSLDQLMSDPKLLAVATVATSMPTGFGELDFSQQQSLLGAQITMSNFQKPAFVQQFVERYLALNAESSSASNDPTGALAILTGSGSASGVLGSLYPGSSSTDSSADGILSAAYPTSSSSDSTSILSLFA
jgi:hypothetical protein